MIFDYLEQYFPLSSQASWDRSGLQIGSDQQDVQRVMVALDASLETLNEAIAQQVDLLITHHPLFLETWTTLSEDTFMGQFVKKAIEHHITVYSLHTCLDRGSQLESMNHWIMKALKIKQTTYYDDEKMGLKGYLEHSMSLQELIDQLYQTFHIDMVRTAGYKEEIKTLAVLAGSGADDLEKLVGQVDAFITGDSKYRHAKYAQEHGIILIDVGHHLEAVMIENVIRLLKSFEIELLPATSKDFYQYWRSI